MENNRLPIDRPPKYGLKMLLNHEFPLQSKQIISPNTKQIFEMLPLAVRYFKYYLGRRMHHKKPIMDYMTMVSAQRMYGCPIGGIGGGTIGRGFKGEFCRFQLCPGIYEYITIPECQFIVNIRNADNKTIFQSVLSTYDKPKKAPATWEWNLNGADCEYTGLYPRAWTTYDLSKYGIKLICRQISPVIPHNYKDSSLPCAVFVWSAENVCDEYRSVSITFTWTEILHSKKKSNAKIEIERYSEETTCGLTLEQKIGDTPCTFTVAKTKQENEMIHDCYCVFNVAKSSNFVWECLKTHGKLEPENMQPNMLTNSKEKKQDVQKEKQSHTKANYRCDAVGLSSVLSLDPGGKDVIEFSLVWDMPIVKFKKDGKVFRRYYTKYFGSDGTSGTSIASYALKNYKSWEKDLTDWQDPILNNSNIPDWLKSALMNELYFVADGGTLWFDVRDEYPETDPRHHFGLFGYLEGHEYRMYNTYDVHFYASFALAQLWPNLQVVLQYMFRDTISVEIKDNRKSLYNGKYVKTKVKDSIPHDLGDPEDEPFVNINAYNIHDVSEWRDLNVKFILQVGRDYRLLRGHSAPFGDRYRSLQFIDQCCDAAADDLYARATHQYREPPAPATPPLAPTPMSTPAYVPPSPPAGNILEMLYRNEDRNEEDGSSVGDKAATAHGGCSAAWDARQYLADMYDACAALLRRTRLWDRDQDGLVENNGSPDQTFDSWVMSGPSAYCGGLWVAAVATMRYLARQLSRSEDELEFDQLLERAKATFHEKLWAGTHYRFDTSLANRRVIMADQLAGVWFLRAIGIIDQVLPVENVRTALKTIYENNVLKFCEGKMGAVNGFVLGEKNQPGEIDRTALQSMEMWIGVTYGLAALMIYEGMYEEAFKTAGGMYSTLTQMGLAYETPEALYENGNHRSIAYMRPLAVWAMYQAITARPPPSPPRAIPNGKPHEVNVTTSL
ncbi:Non-lysosomal glucosylceramidase [Eumeta japonica]|uniref:Non-lysosomal glucosylceramidase n=1 Tax=Eumeta variegata TaxID=151549 RepID=A0A4C1Z0E4_EUMVA|nr:Non-lysosomal glucosylceramidase [Eumeta japonica]